MFTIEQLLAPLSRDHPCGEDIAFSPELDAIALARRSDLRAVGTRPDADWDFVARRCAQLIRLRSKNLKLAVWLTEAAAINAGMRGLGDGLLLVAGLCERYWDSVFPLPDEQGCELRIGHLCWIAARTPQLLAAIAAGAGPAFGAGARPPHETRLLDACHCMGAITELERVIDARLGAAGPSMSAAQRSLERMMPALTAAARAQPEGPASAPVAWAPAQTREHAVAQLREAAAFFRRTEPDSPVAYLAEKAASWGEQPLHVWLHGVVNDPAAFAQLARMLDLGADAKPSH
ncbi:ImpA family type VI secretion system protein [Massilia glaciei]|uniref:Type VI secretion system protein TssA n=1 Tax=Massilia glaciei TaxID=1524097 RepID=A0A2U2HJ73_9BURK|nr:type VI secretion system ImpA family N-terminal domain-containing protein [Massilia glaciei]PWF46799.1 type VI secretion system protein TssA [Massilia glaciei]